MQDIFCELVEVKLMKRLLQKNRKKLRRKYVRKAEKNWEKGWYLSVFLPIVKGEKKCSSCTCSELATLRCSRCKQAAYCSVKCQKRHWKIHKTNCKNY